MWEYKQYHQHKSIGRLDRFILKRRDRATFNMIAKFIVCKSVLEIGPGRCTYGLLCKDKSIAYTAIEASSIGIECARKLGLNVYKAVFPDWERLRLLRGFDVFMARSVLEHVRDTVHANDFIETAKRCLRPGGVMFIEAPDIRFWKWLYWGSDYGHNYVCSLERMKQLMQEYDLEILQCGMRSQFINNPFDRICYWLSFLPFSSKIKTSLLPGAYVIARKNIS